MATSKIQTNINVGKSEKASLVTFYNLIIDLNNTKVINFGAGQSYRTFLFLATGSGSQGSGLYSLNYSSNGTGVLTPILAIHSSISLTIGKDTLTIQNGTTVSVWATLMIMNGSLDQITVS